MEEKKPVTIGYRVGMLTVTDETPERKNGYRIWRCRCDCGGEIRLDTRCLQRRTVLDCGCNTRVKPGMLDLTGQRFGMLTCLRQAAEKDKRGNTQWICRCDCGRLCTSAVGQLRAGYRKSCGCLSHPPLKDYVGRRFHRLTVIAYAGKTNGMHRWKCRCDCGRETIVGQTLLQSGKTKSCGCLLRAEKADAPEGSVFIDGTNAAILEARMTKPPIASNTSGYNGVYRNASDRWTAQITFRKKTYYLGSYEDIHQAVRARKQAEEMFKSFLERYYAAYPDRKKTP